MSVTYNGQSSLRDCVIHIDAANPKCYPGTGQIAYDLSGNGKNGAIIGATHSTGQGGKFTFDGVNDVIDFGTGNTIFPLQQITFEFAFRSTGTVPTTATTPGLCGLTYGIRLFVYPTFLAGGIDDGSTFVMLYTSGTGDFYNGAWNHVTVTHDGQMMRIYLNGVLNNSVACGWRGVTRWPSNGAYIGRDNNDQMYFFYGDISIFRLYSRALSSSEVMSNFNSIRGRYGI